MKKIGNHIPPLLLGVLFYCVLTSFQTRSVYTRVTLDKSMTVLDLLKRYQLADYSCNIEQFKKLNRLKEGQTLKKGNTYTLPLWIETYNGRSIRSSLNVDLPTAQRIQSYNIAIFDKKTLKQKYTESKRLYVPYHLIYCKNEVKTPINPPNARLPYPESSQNSKGLYPIFGKKYQKVPVLSSRLKGKVFYVESGHGGPDPGAQARVDNRTLCEDEYAYDVALRVARALIMNGATVYIITRDPNDGIRDGRYLLCDTDEQTLPALRVPLAQSARLQQRSDAINALYESCRKRGVTDQRLIVIHVDSRGKKEQIDTFFYYKDGDAKSKKIASNVHHYFVAKYRNQRSYTGTLTSRDLHMLRECKPPAVYVELGNIRNAQDRIRLLDADQRQAIANWLAEGLMR